MAKINDILGLDASGRATQYTNNAQNAANPQSVSDDNTPFFEAKPLYEIGKQNVADDKTTFEVTEEKDANGNVVTPGQKVVIGHLDNSPLPSTADYRDQRLDHIINAGKQYDASVAQRTEAAKPKRLTYTEMVDMLYPEQAEARRKADEERVSKRRKRDAIINALGDGLTTIANLGGVIAGGNPVAQETTMSARSQAMYDKLKADADARHDAYRAARIRAQQAEKQREDTLNTAAAAAKQHKEDADREMDKYLEQLNYYRERDGLNRTSREKIASANNAARLETSKMSADARRYAADHKKSGSGSARVSVPIYNEYTGKMEYLPVTPNAALQYLQNAYGEDNTKTEVDKATGLKKETTTRNGNRKKSAQKTKANLPNSKRAKNRGALN